MTPENLEALEASLSEAQRTALLAAWPYPDFHRNGPQVSYCPVTVNSRQADAMDRKGITACKASGGPRLTKLGLLLRDYIKENTND